MVPVFTFCCSESNDIVVCCSSSDIPHSGVSVELGVIQVVTKPSKIQIRELGLFFNGSGRLYR